METYAPKLNLSVKRYLRSLNSDLDLVKARIYQTAEFGFLYHHSHSIHSDSLSFLQKSILYLEDRNFFFHNGIEVRSFPRAVKRRLRGRPFGGVSTIDQQVVRLATRRMERTINRKTKELLLSYALNYHVSKKMIFYFYMHESYFGYKLIGCEIASRHIFSAPAIELDLDRSCFLASLLPLPLPRLVFELCESKVFGHQPLPEDILSHPDVAKTRWARRVSYRYNLGRSAQEFIANNRWSK